LDKEKAVFEAFRTELSKLLNDYPENDGALKLAMRNFLNKLIEDVNQVVDKKMDINAFAKKSETYFEQNSKDKDVIKLQQPDGPFYKLRYAIAATLRTICRMFDYTWYCSGFKTSMLEKGNPIAKATLGRKNFFELPEASLKDQFKKLKEQHVAAMKDLDSPGASSAKPVG